ncbi:MAG: DUF1289 domain-containing protein [Pseudomonadota bacterium]
MSKVPSPCIDVCKFRLQGHCIGCGMTKKTKKAFKKLEGSRRRIAFIEALLATQHRVGVKTRGWEKAYRKRCVKKGVECPLDTVKEAA